MGWGLAVVYVGQQTWGKTPRALPAAALAVLRRVTRCNAAFVNASQGTLDADDATAKAVHEGFPDSTVIFLDIERMQTVPASMRAYYSALGSVVCSRTAATGPGSTRTSTTPR